jgi:cytidine deaminase
MDTELIEVASRLIELRTDDENHTVASAARGNDGQIVIGVNVRHFTGGPCAELIVIGRAVTDGVAELREIVAVGDRGRGVLSPCGRCRQVLHDYFPDIRVIVPADAELRSVSILDLLPWSYRSEP